MPVPTAPSVSDSEASPKAHAGISVYHANETTNTANVPCEMATLASTAGVDSAGSSAGSFGV